MKQAHSVATASLSQTDFYKIMAISVGTLLGDAFLLRSKEKRGNSARLTIKQSNIHEEWLLMLHDFYSKYGLCNPEKPKLGTLKNGYQYLRFHTFANPIFTELHNLFYVKKGGKFVKRVSLLISKYFDATTLAAWLCDDGTAHNGSSAFCTDSFTPECLNNLIAIVSDKFGIKLIPYMHLKKYNRLQVAREDMPKFVALVKPHLPATMYHKLGDFNV